MYCSIWFPYRELLQFIAAINHIAAKEAKSIPDKTAMIPNNQQNIKMK